MWLIAFLWANPFLTYIYLGFASCLEPWFKLFG